MEPDITKTKFTLLLPLNYNDGSEVPRAILNQMCNEIFDFSDGFGLAGEMTGAYRMKDGTRKDDRLMVMWIGVSEAQVETLKLMVGRFARELRQESLYLERTGGKIEFIPPLGPED